MSLITRMLKQTAVYWALQGDESGSKDHDAFGRTQWTTPIEISCRWEDKNEKFVDESGEEQVSKAVVYVDQDALLGGVLMLGELTDITDAVNIKENNGAFEIRAFNKTPNLGATEFLRTAIL